jgi:protease II
VSPDGSKAAYFVDSKGDEYYTLFFRDLNTGNDLPDVISNTDCQVDGIQQKISLSITY